MSQEVKRKLNLSSMKKDSVNKQSDIDETNPLDLSQDNIVPEESISETDDSDFNSDEDLEEIMKETISKAIPEEDQTKLVSEIVKEVKKNKISLAGMKAKRQENNLPKKKIVEEKTIEEPIEPKEDKRKNQKTVSLSGEKVEIELNTPKEKQTPSKDKEGNTAATIKADSSLGKKETDTNTQSSGPEKKKVLIQLNNKKTVTTPEKEVNKNIQNSEEKISAEGKQENRKAAENKEINTKTEITEEKNKITEIREESEDKQEKQNEDDNSPIMFGDKPLAKEKEGLFTNYTSDFIEEESSIIQKLKKLKGLPKTRPALIGGLIGATILGIGGLFYFDPGRHSIDNYKAVLLGHSNNSSSAKTEDSPTTADTTDENSNEGDTPGIKAEEKVSWGIESIIRSGYKITLEARTNILGEKLYRYKNIEFSTLEELNKELDNDIKKLKKNKVQDFLLPKKKKAPEEESVENSKEESKESETENASEKQKALLKLLQNKK